MAKCRANINLFGNFDVFRLRADSRITVPLSVPLECTVSFGEVEVGDALRFDPGR